MPEKPPEPVPESLREEALRAIEEIGSEPSEELLALYEAHYEVVGTAARNLALAEAARRYGFELKEAFFPIDNLTKNWARRFAAERVTVFDETGKRAIAEAIAQTLWERRGTPGAYREIRDMLYARQDFFRGLTAPQISSLFRERRELLDDGYSASEADALIEVSRRAKIRDRAETIARTEMRDAVSQGTLYQHTRLGATTKSWGTRGDDRVSEVCNENASAGWIEMDASFPSGHDAPTSHPNCRCVLKTQMLNAQELAQRLREEGAI